MSNNTEVKEVHRLSQQAYAQLERSMPEPIAKDAVQAAYNLGIQRVLAALRTGFVV